MGSYVHKLREVKQNKAHTHTHTHPATVDNIHDAVTLKCQVAVQ